MNFNYQPTRNQIPMGIGYPPQNGMYGNYGMNNQYGYGTQAAPIYPQGGYCQSYGGMSNGGFGRRNHNNFNRGMGGCRR